jgi:hypothetical protein
MHCSFGLHGFEQKLEYTIRYTYTGTKYTWPEHSDDPHANITWYQI